MGVIIKMMNAIEEQDHKSGQASPLETSTAFVDTKPQNKYNWTTMVIVACVLAVAAGVAFVLWKNPNFYKHIEQYYPCIPVAITSLIALKQVVFKDWRNYTHAWARWGLLFLITLLFLASILVQNQQIKEKAAKDARAEAAETAQRNNTEVFIRLNKTLQGQIMTLEARLANEHKAVPKAPVDVALSFAGPKSPTLAIINKSSVVAKQIKWTVALWNIDRAEKSPLPIPVATFDWLRAHGRSGPLDLFGARQVAALLKPGDRFYETASVDCPECGRGRIYAVYIRWGEGGWFAEIEGEKSGGLFVPNFSADADLALANYGLTLETSIPSHLRKPIDQ